MDQCLEELRHDQGDPQYQELSAHGSGEVNGTGSPRHDAGLSSFSQVLLRSMFSFPGTKKKVKTVKSMCGGPWDPTCPKQQLGFKLLLQPARSVEAREGLSIKKMLALLVIKKTRFKTWHPARRTVLGGLK